MKWTREQIEQQVLLQVGRVISRPLTEDALEQRLEELGVDSLNTVLLLCEFENRHMFRIDLEQFSRVRLDTVRSLAELIYAWQRTNGEQ